MPDIKLCDKDLNKRFQTIMKKYWKLIQKEDMDFIQLVILRYKEHSHNEYYTVLILIYWFLFFEAIKLDDELITDDDRKNISRIVRSYNYDINWDFENYLRDMFEYEYDLFLVKIILKYSLLNSQDRYINIVWNLENYIKSIGYLIPLMTFKEVHFLGFFQDYYFKNIYPEEYKKIKKIHLSRTSQLELPGEYIISKINTIWELMLMSWVSWILKVRKKSYFSLYAKYNLNKNMDITDYIWMRIIFNNMIDLNKFIKWFEADHIFLKKKDYIKNPKENNYKAIHYAYITAFRSSQILVELQIKTKKMENELKKKKTLTHYAYTIKEHKWDPLFKEVHDWYKIYREYLKS